MRFVMIETKYFGEIAINVNSVTSLHQRDEGVVLYLPGDNPIITLFTDIQHAVDYLQRAPSVSLGEA